MTALLHRDSPDDERVLELLGELREMCLHGRPYLSELPVVDMWTAVVVGRRGDHYGAIPPARDALNALFDAGQHAYCVVATRVLVELLVDRGGCADLDEAQVAVDRLTAAPLCEDYVLRDLILLRLRALLARAHGDERGYRDFACRYLNMANRLGFEGHMALAEAMT